MCKTHVKLVTHNITNMMMNLKVEDVWYCLEKMFLSSLSLQRYILNHYIWHLCWKDEPMYYHSCWKVLWKYRWCHKDTKKFKRKNHNDELVWIYLFQQDLNLLRLKWHWSFSEKQKILRINIWSQKSENLWWCFVIHK